VRPGHRRLEAPARSATSCQAASWQTAIANALAIPLPDRVRSMRVRWAGSYGRGALSQELTHPPSAAGAVWKFGSRQWLVELVASDR
jgi:hypothetical protein